MIRKQGDEVPPKSETLLTGLEMVSIKRQGCQQTLTLAPL